MNNYTNSTPILEQFEVSTFLYVLIVGITLIFYFLVLCLGLVFIMSLFLLYKYHNDFKSNIDKIILKLAGNKEDKNTNSNEYTVKIYQGYLGYSRLSFSILFALKIALYTLLRIIELIALNNNDRFNLKKSRNYYNISIWLSGTTYFTLAIALGLYYSKLSFKAWFISLIVYFLHSIVAIGFTAFPLISIVTILLYKFRLHTFIFPLHVRNSFRSLYSKSIFSPSLKQGLPSLRISYFRLDFLSDNMCLFIEFILSIWCFLGYIIKIILGIITVLFRLTILFLIFLVIYNIIMFDLSLFDDVYIIVKNFYSNYILVIKKLLLIKPVENQDYFLKHLSNRLASALNSIFNKNN